MKASDCYQPIREQYKEILGIVKGLPHLKDTRQTTFPLGQMPYVYWIENGKVNHAVFGGFNSVTTQVNHGAIFYCKGLIFVQEEDLELVEISVYPKERGKTILIRSDNPNINLRETMAEIKITATALFILYEAKDPRGRRASKFDPDGIK